MRLQRSGFNMEVQNNIYNYTTCFTNPKILNLKKNSTKRLIMSIESYE